MTKKDYILIAEAIKNSCVGLQSKELTRQKKNQQRQGISDVIIELGKILKKDNNKFDYRKFVEACNNY